MPLPLLRSDSSDGGSLLDRPGPIYSWDELLSSRVDHKPKDFQCGRPYQVLFLGSEDYRTVPGHIIPQDSRHPVAHFPGSAIGKRPPVKHTRLYMQTGKQ